MQMMKRIDEWYKTLPVISSVPREEDSSCDVPIVEKEIKRRRRRHII
jgi:hypothetical protein